MKAHRLLICGLLRRLANLKADVVLNSVANYTEFKGAMAENALLQNILPLLKNDMPHYWTSGNQAEVEFLIQSGVDIVPIEVKAENCVSGRSLAVYNEKYQPRKRLRFSMLNYKEDGNLINSPSPLAEWIIKFLTE